MLTLFSRSVTLNVYDNQTELIEIYTMFKIVV